MGEAAGCFLLIRQVRYFGRTCKPAVPSFFKVVGAVKQYMLYAAFIALPFFARAQDCCGPGGGGGGAVFTTAQNHGVNYRIKNVRPYAYSVRHPGFTLGLETGGIPDGSRANISPRVEYSGSFGSFDGYGGAFYSVFFGKPHSHQIDAAENIAWRLAPDKDSRLVFRIDNEDLLVFFPDTLLFAYAALDPGVAYSRAFGFGDLSLSLGLPALIKPERGLTSYVSLGYEHPAGLSLSVCPRLALVPAVLYSGTTVTLGFAWDKCFAKAVFIVNKDFSAVDIRPYGEFTLGHVVFWAGAELGGLGGEDVSVNPFIGTAYHF
ncbi:MAG: hypothetical protein LBU25_02140 [Treponema sp.]|nr:hypothetical protein [Treponema sp.]